MTEEKRTFRIDVNKELLDGVEKQFCYVEVKGKMVRVRSLSSVCTEAFLSGILRMTDELKALREKFGSQVYLKSKGIGFAELELNEPQEHDEPRTVV